MISATCAFMPMRAPQRLRARRMHGLSRSEVEIVFGAGEWSPETSAGRALLAHELCHVAQQTAAPQLDPSTLAEADQSPRLRLQRKPPAAPAPLPTALDQYPAAERKSLSVFTSPVPPADIATIYAPVPAAGVKSSGLNPNPDMVFAFDPAIAAAEQAKLIEVAALITGQIKPPLGPGQTISLERRANRQGDALQPHRAWDAGSGRDADRATRGDTRPLRPSQQARRRARRNSRRRNTRSTRRWAMRASRTPCVRRSRLSRIPPCARA